MNGFKRSSRRQAAVVGLAVLMGASFLGCHAGPRLFSKKDRASQADKQELAEKDKGKFINRKKARPESDYRHDEGDERVAKSDPKAKPKTKPSDSIRKPTTNDASRALAARKPVDDEPQSATRSSKATTAPPKSAKPSEQPQFARKDTTRRPVTDLLNDSMFDDELPDSLPSAPPPTAKKSVTKPITTAKTNPADEDPFKNSVVSSSKPTRPNEKVATVNFDDEEDLDLGLDDEAAEEAEELAEAKALAAQKSAASVKAAAAALDRRATQTTSTGQRKFLEVFDEEPAESSTIAEHAPPTPKTADKPRVSRPPVKRPTDAAKTVAGQEVIDRRQSAQQTVKDWQRAFERDELAESDKEPIASASRIAAHSNSASPAKGHLSPLTIDEFSPPAKSQGATLNGELIIDTNSLPPRFQRSSTSPAGANSNSGTMGKINANSGANIEIVPGSTQNRARSAGQISLQSLSDPESSTGLTTADYEQSSTPEDLGSLPLLNIDSDADNGPKLAALEVDGGIAPPPPDMGELVPAISVAEIPSGTRGWKRTLLVLSAFFSAVGIGFALRRRNQLTAAPAVIPKFSRPADGRPHDAEQWPRG